MRAGRLLNLLLVLRNGGRHTARELAERLCVSERTILRDIDELSGVGVPVYGVRGPGGGFELLDTFELAVPALPPGLDVRRRGTRRVRVVLAPSALQVALVNGRPDGWRPRPHADAPVDRPDWLEGSFRFDSFDAAIRELVAIGPDVEVLLPVELRDAMAAFGRRLSSLHRSVSPPSPRSADRA